MTEPLRVWAPNAKTVDVVVNGSDDRVSTRADERGWFTATEAIAPGTDYRFTLDGGDALPDPRSRSQPDGPHGPSRRVVTREPSSTFVPRPWREQIIYEMHVGTFAPGGTFAAAIGQLDHLVDLGVTAVEVMPVAEFPGERGWGYDGVDFYAAHHHYGGPDAFVAFIDASHQRGLAVILDVVYNHLGPDGNYLASYGPYFTGRYATPWGAAINFDDRHSDDVRRFFLDNARMWLHEFGCDGLRLDAVHAILDESATHIVEQIVNEADGKWIIAESAANDPRIVRDRDRGGFGCTAQWSDDFHHALHVALTGERDGFYVDYEGLPDLAAALTRPFVLDGRYSPYRQRSHGRPADDLPFERFVVCSQNHDQVGNRAAGERLVHLVGFDGAKMAAALTLLSPFVPMLFQGEEWGASAPFQYFTDHRDPNLARAVSDGRRREFAAFGWNPDDVPDPQDPATFERSCLHWEERTQPDHAAMLDWYRALIALRRTHADLHAGSDAKPTVLYDAAVSTLTMQRGALALAIDIAARTTTVTLDGDVVLASNEGTTS